MIYKKKEDGQTEVIPETLEEELAIEWVSKHRPVIAGVEPYGFNAFIAGYKKALEINK